MTTQSFTMVKQRELQALFHTATLNLNTATMRARNLAAQLEAERALIGLFAARRGVRPR